MKLAWELANQVLMRSLDDVPPQTRRLLLLIDKMVTSECERLQIERLDYRFTRRHGAAVHGLGRLAAEEASASRWKTWNTWRCIAARRDRASSTRSTSRWTTSGRPVLPGLSYGANRSRSEEGVSPSRPGCHRPVTARSRGCRGVVTVTESPASMRAEGDFTGEKRKTHI